MTKKRAFIGMSGGVDSSVAALCMLEEGYNCIGGTLKLHNLSCGGKNDAADAAAVAQKLGLPHLVVDFQEQFDHIVMRGFADAYDQGLTPNPCIACNRFLKFGAMLDYAISLGCDYVVTGHYARICTDEITGRTLLYSAADEAKDQTYFLAGLNQYQLSHAKFPLGELTKPEVRRIAEENGLLTARKKDSQDICFVPDGDYAGFLRRYTGKDYPAGQYLNLQGQAVGTHQGAVCYTIGQRKGLGIALGEPMYVCEKDMLSNTVTLGPNDALYSKSLLAGDWNWFPFPTLTEPMRITAKTRHTRLTSAATVYPEENGLARVVFDAPVRAITPGQAVVLYDGNLVVGGGTILRAM